MNPKVLGAHKHRTIHFSLSNNICNKEKTTLQHCKNAIIVFGETSKDRLSIIARLQRQKKDNRNQESKNKKQKYWTV